MRVPLVLIPAIAATFACGPSEPPGAAAAVTVDALQPLAAGAPLAPLPAPKTPADDPKVQLGKRLFNDQRLSSNGRTACSSCHDVSQGGDDGRRYSTGPTGEPLPVNTPTVLNSGLNFAQFWDGRARTLEAQIRETLARRAEMGASAATTAAVLARDAEAVAAFRSVYGQEPQPEHVVDAIATYVRALTAPGAPIDRFLQGDRETIGKRAREGYELFRKFGCVSCHQGRNIGGNMFQHLGVMRDYFSDQANVTAADLGRFNVTGRERDRYKFKVRSLRNVAETAPYFHDGSAATLEDAVRIMLEYQIGREPSETEIAALLAFLETLSGNVRAPLL